MIKKILILLICVNGIASATEADKITPEAAEQSSQLEYPLMKQAAAFAAYFVKNRHNDDPVPESILSNIQNLPLEKLGDLLNASYFLMRQKVNFPLGRLEGLFELKFNHMRAKEVLSAEYSFKCDYCIYIINTFIEAEVLQ